MLTKFSIDYVVFPRRSPQVRTYLTDDPIEAEEFIMHLLLVHAQIKGISHEGASLTGHQFDRMLKVAAERIAAGLLGEALHLDAGEIKRRFGFAA